MSANLILTILSLLGEIPISAAMPPATVPTAVVASWATPRTINYACPDPNAPVDPMGQPAMVSQYHYACDATGCQAQSVSVPVLLVPQNQSCHKDVRESHHQLFPTLLAAGEFRLACAEGACREWSIRPATDQEVVDFALQKKHWQIMHYPGGDADRYPNGVYEIYPRDEKKFDRALGQGSTDLAAVADALQKAGD